MQLVWIKTGWCSSRGNVFEPAKRGFNVNSGLIFEASDDDLVGIKTKHDGGLRGSYDHMEWNWSWFGSKQVGVPYITVDYFLSMDGCKIIGGI